MKLLQYKDKRGFSLQYPETWACKEIPHGLAFVAPKDLEDTNDLHRNNLVFIIQKLPTRMDIHEYHKANMAIVRREHKVLAASKMQEEAINGLPFGVIRLELEEGTETVSVLQAWTTVLSIGFTFTFTAEKADFDQDVQAARDIIASFVLKPNTQENR